MKKLLLQLFLLALISGAVIFFQFNQIPKKLSYDEVEFAKLTLSLKDKAYIPYSTAATGHSTLYFYLILFSFQTFGVNSFALRLPSAFFGILNVLVFFLVLRIVFRRFFYNRKNLLDKTLFSAFTLRSTLPFFLSCILLTLRWYFNFARFSFEATFLLFLELVSIWLLFLWRESKKSHYFAGSAICAGLAFLSYYPGRIFFLLPSSMVYFLTTKNRMMNALKYVLIIFVVALPLIVYLITHQDLRVKEQLFLTDKKLTVSQKATYFISNIAKSAYVFHLAGDLNGRHNYPGKPVLNPVVGAFFLFGLLVALLNMHFFYHRFFLAFFVIGIIPALFTYPSENPNILRTFTAVIPVVYFIGNGIVYLFESESKARKTTFLVFSALAVFFILGSLYDIRTYFRYQKNVFKKSFEVNGTLQRILKLKLWEKVNDL